MRRAHDARGALFDAEQSLRQAQELVAAGAVALLVAAIAVIVLLVSALIAVYGFNASWGTLAPLAFMAFFVWMHVGGHASTSLATVGRATLRPAYAVA